MGSSSVTGSYRPGITGGSLSGNTETVHLSDRDNTTLGFLGGTHNGTVWDSTNSVLSMDTSGAMTNLAELDSSWTPQWANIVGYWKLNGTIGAITNGATATPVIGPAGTISVPPRKPSAVLLLSER